MPGRSSSGGESQSRLPPPFTCIAVSQRTRSSQSRQRRRIERDIHPAEPAQRVPVRHSHEASQ